MQRSRGLHGEKPRPEGRTRRGKCGLRDRARQQGRRKTAQAPHQHSIRKLARQVVGLPDERDRGREDEPRKKERRLCIQGMPPPVQESRRPVTHSHCGNEQPESDETRDGLPVRGDEPDHPNAEEQGPKHRDDARHSKGSSWGLKRAECPPSAPMGQI